MNCKHPDNRKSFDKLISASKILQLLGRGFSPVDIASWAAEFGEEPVKVIHCKDCKYAQNPNDTMVYCTYFECGTMSQNDFCSQGEKEDAEK